jgi:hypothetical protein
VPLVGVPLSDNDNDDETDDQTDDTEPPAIQAVVLGMQHGAGYIYVSSALHPFTNAGLRHPDNAAFVLNLLRRTTNPTDGHILFDEWHHGFHTPPSLRGLVLGSAWGQGVVYALVVLAIYLVWTGRRFGQPVPLHEDVVQRSSAEYVASMADLFQRGRKHEYILHHYAQRFKRTLARPYGINPRLDDAAFVAELTRYNETLNKETLLALLARLRRERVSEEYLTRTVAETLAYTEQTKR